MSTDLHGTVPVGDVTDASVWDAFVDRAPNGTIMHRWAWREIVQDAYGHRSIFLGAFNGSELQGVLPLVLLSSRLFGKHLVSMPFGDAGGPCSFDEASDRSLVLAAKDLARAQGATLDLRCEGARAIDLPCSLEKVGMVLELGASEDSVWKALPSERRNRIKKAQRAGLVGTVQGVEALGDFYSVFARNMRDLGSPVHARRFFDAILTRLPDHTRIVVVRAGEQPVGAALMLRHRDTISIPWVSSLRESFAMYPNQMLYWRAMQYAVAEGVRMLDFGRSSVGTGTYEAKRQWGARPVQLHWYRYPDSARSPGEEATRLGWAMRAWRHLPLPIANAIGPRLRGSIAN